MRAAAGDEWKVLTLTAETARNAVVALVVFGDKDTSEPIILGQSVGGLLHLGQSMGVLFHLDQSVGGLSHVDHSVCSTVTSRRMVCSTLDSLWVVCFTPDTSTNSKYDVLR